MKTFVCVLALVAAVVAEAPYRSQFANQQSQESAPYPAAGFKPAREFTLPQQQYSPQYNYEATTNANIPADSYGVPSYTYVAPSNTYGPPSNAYGPPSDTYGGPVNDENNDAENIDDQKVENAKLEEAKDDAEVVNTKGAYYVLLPGSQLQRVQFQTENDIRNMAYTARLQYKNEDRAPIFVYNPVPQYQETAAYVQLIK